MLGRSCKTVGVYNNTAGTVFLKEGTEFEILVRYFDAKNSRTVLTTRSKRKTYSRVNLLRIKPFVVIDYERNDEWIRNITAVRFIYNFYIRNTFP